ncbi:Protein of unknown function [Cellulomonas marina]|uniref:DUF3515 domain-containing protein n=1 Tax=Cellulomonas marina TaxID=988821 RepID=A0A1I0YR23_9CELL|nr:Protein of unknown function [Cellulomonas marina]
MLVLAGCAATVPTTAGPEATDPVCAEVVLALPEDLGDGLVQQRTDAQATTAWGDPRAAVVLRCGVEPLGPTTDRCVTLETPDGGSVDWVVVEDDDGSWTFTTYGRAPAVEVQVPAAVAGDRSTSFVVDLGPAVSRTQVERSCV